jgi:hypothetical protein
MSCAFISPLVTASNSGRSSLCGFPNCPRDSATAIHGYLVYNYYIFKKKQFKLKLSTQLKKALSSQLNFCPIKLPAYDITLIARKHRSQGYSVVASVILGAIAYQLSLFTELLLSRS